MPDDALKSTASLNEQHFAIHAEARARTLAPWRARNRNWSNLAKDLVE